MRPQRTAGHTRGQLAWMSKKKKILNPSAKAEKHQENPSGGWGSLWRKREELRTFLLSFLKPGINTTTCWSLLTRPLGLNSEKWNTFIQYHVSDHSGWCGLWMNQVASLGNFWNHNKYFGFAYSGRLWRSLYFPGCRDEAWGFPGGSDGKESACKAGDPGSIPGLGRSPGKGKGNPLRYSCLGNPTDRGAWVPHWARTCAVLLTHLTDKEFRFRKVKWLIQDHTAWIYIWKSQSPCFQNSLPVGVSNGCWAVFFKIFSYNLLLLLLSLLFFFFLVSILVEQPYDKLHI